MSSNGQELGSECFCSLHTFAGARVVAILVHTSGFVTFSGRGSGLGQPRSYFVSSWCSVTTVD